MSGEFLLEFLEVPQYLIKQNCLISSNINFYQIHVKVKIWQPIVLMHSEELF